MGTTKLNPHKAGDKAGTRAVIGAVIAIMVLGMTSCSSSAGPTASIPSQAAIQPSETASPNLADEDLTVEEKEAAYKEEVKDLVNDNDFGLTLDSEDELASLQFYDIYITNEDYNKDKNLGCELIVRYICRFDGKEADSVCIRAYKMDESLYREFKYDSEILDTIDLFFEYLEENKSEFLYQYGILNERLTERDIKAAEGSYVHFTGEDFQEAFGSQATGSPDEAPDTAE